MRFALGLVAAGRYTGRATCEPVSIEINPVVPSGRLEFLHEMGHYMTTT